MEVIINLFVPFIVLVILGTTVDRIIVFLEELMNPIPFLPDKIESKLAFIILVAVGFGICYEFDYNLFAYLNHPGKHELSGYIFTAVLISGGSSYLSRSFEGINQIPGMIGNLTTSFFNMMGKPKK